MANQQLWIEFLGIVGTFWAGQMGLTYFVFRSQRKAHKEQTKMLIDTYESRIADLISEREEAQEKADEKD